jgi:ABC-type multidrug transport system fused ATPase/permease subunit
VRVRIARINAMIQETVTGMKVVQLFTREERNQRDFDALNADHRDAWLQSIRYDAALFAVVEIANGLSTAVIIGYGASLVIGGDMTLGTLYVFMDWMRRFFLPLRDLSAKYSVMQSSMASCERIFQLLDTEPAVRDARRRRPRRGRPRRGRTGEVVFEHVWFAYQGEDWVLRDVSLRVAPGERAALVGATGAGKTSVIKLLTRLYEPTRGRVLLDGVDLREIPQRELRRRIAMVLQDVFLFSGSVASNIALGRPDLDRATWSGPRGRWRRIASSSGSRRATTPSSASAAATCLGGPAPAALVRARRRPRRGRAGARRGHQLGRRRDRAAGAARHHALLDAAHGDRHRAPALHDPGRGHDPRAAPRPLVESGSHAELLARRGAYWRLYRLQFEHAGEPAREAV